MISQPLAQKINQAFLSRYPIIYIEGKEEDRIEATLAAIAATLYKDKQDLITWSAFLGFSDSHDCKDPLEALERISSAQNPAMYLLKDFPTEFDNPRVVRAVRDLYSSIKNMGSYVFFSFPSIRIPDLLSNEIYLV